MASGVTDVGPYVEKLKGVPNLAELHIIPANAIKANSESRFDAVETKVFSTRAAEDLNRLTSNLQELLGKFSLDRETAGSGSRQKTHVSRTKKLLQ